MPVNKVMLIGRLGKNPDIRTTQDGREVATFSLATSERWKDKSTGERKEKTEWHKIVIFNPGIVNVVKNYVKKGSNIYVEGSLQTRKWQDQSGQEKYTTEIVLQAFNGTLQLLDSKKDGDITSNNTEDYNAGSSTSNNDFVNPEMDDEIPF